jgi:deazaflavin-dependent oxidoreductase (nitroreductase family)
MPAAAKRVIKWVNRLLAGRIARSGKAFGTMPALVLTTVGRKTGKERRTPLAYIPEERGNWLIIAAYAGAVENPAWYYNLAAHPDRVSIELDGNLYQVAVEELHGNQRDLAWKRITQANSRFAEYQKKTDRELPVIRLVTRD